MLKIVFSFLLLINFLFSNDDILKQKNVLAVKNVIAKEEAIAYEVEKYILKELSIPTLEDLMTNDYLGTNFNLSSRLGDDISFSNLTDLGLKISINEKVSENNPYLKLLYKRELYRKNTSVSWDMDYKNAYVSIKLKSDEANIIFNILKDGKSILKTCSNSLIMQYCQSSEMTIRWYTSDSQWIEYDKKTFENGNVAVSGNDFLDTTNSETASILSKLPIGTKIYLGENIKLKTEDNKYMDIDL